MCDQSDSTTLDEKVLETLNPSIVRKLSHPSAGTEKLKVAGVSDQGDLIGETKVKVVSDKQEFDFDDR